MNNLTIAGNLGRDVRTNTVNTANGSTTVANFVVAVRKSRKGPDGKPMTLWVDCAMWGARADALAQYLTKGTKVVVCGEADVETFTDSNGVTVPKMTLKVTELTLMGSNEQAQQPQQAPAQQQYQPPVQPQRPAMTPPAQPRQPAPAQAPAAAAAGDGTDWDSEIPF